MILIYHFSDLTNGRLILMHIAYKKCHCSNRKYDKLIQNTFLKKIAAGDFPSSGKYNY